MKLNIYIYYDTNNGHSLTTTIFKTGILLDDKKVREITLIHAPSASRMGCSASTFCDFLRKDGHIVEEIVEYKSDKSIEKIIRLNGVSGNY